MHHNNILLMVLYCLKVINMYLPINLSFIGTIRVSKMSIPEKCNDCLISKLS